MQILANTVFLGTIEVCVHNRWHRVCDFNWTQADAIVACVQLELERTGIIFKFKITESAFRAVVLYSDAVAVYFNEIEVLKDRMGRNVTDTCICHGNETFYEQCEGTMASRRPKELEIIAGALCQDLQPSP